MTSAPMQSSQNGPAPVPNGAVPAKSSIPTLEQINMGEARDRQKLEIEAMVSAMVLHDSSFQGKLNTQIVWHFLQAPDSCWGWTTGGPMPLNTKLLCVAACLKLGFTPGMGHVIWMGNKPYVSAEGLRLKSNRDPAWVYTKAPRLRPMNQDEKELYGIEAGDLGAVIMATVNFKGQEMEMEGVGIIEKGCNKPGSVGKKNRAMKVRTFAERDMLRRFYPCDVPVYCEEEDSGPQLASANIAPQLDAGVLVKAAHANELAQARQAFDKEVIRLLAGGVTKDEITGELGLSPEIVSGGDNPTIILNAAEVLAGIHAMPTTPTPPPAKQPKSAAAEEALVNAVNAPEVAAPVKRGPGRPPKAKAAPAPQPAAAAPVTAPQPDLKAMAAKHLADHGTPSPAAEAGYQAARAEIEGEVVDCSYDEEPTQEEMAAEVGDGSQALPPPHRVGIRGDHPATQSWSDKTATQDTYRIENPTAYELIQKLLQTPEAKKDVEIEMALHAAYELKLKGGDQVEIAKCFRLAKGGDLSAFTELEKVRERL